MGNRFLVFLIILGMAFFAGWLFGNEVAPPRMADVSAAMWLAMAGAAVISSLVMAVGR
ncbi:MAG: hypothetical protein R3C14_22700 [Caldilineaceae bacterium]